MLNPGADLVTPVDLTIDYASSLEFGVRGSITGNALADNELLSAGPVSIRGTAEFALTRSTTDVDTDGNGVPNLFGAELDQVALTVTGAVVNVNGVATLTVSGGLALARVTPAGGTTARYTALKMGDVTVSASTRGPGF